MRKRRRSEGKEMQGEGDETGQAEDQTHRSHIFLDRVVDLALDVRVPRDQRLSKLWPPAPGRLGHLAQVPRARAVRVREVLCRLVREAKLLHELDREVVAVALAAEERDLSSHARPGRRRHGGVAAGPRPLPRVSLVEIARLDDAVDDVLCHLAVRRPLAAADKGDSRLGVGAEGGREGGREGWMEGGREGGMEGGSKE